MKLEDRVSAGLRKTHKPCQLSRKGREERGGGKGGSRGGEEEGSLWRGAKARQRLQARLVYLAHKPSTLPKNSARHLTQVSGRHSPEAAGNSINSSW